MISGSPPPPPRNNAKFTKYPNIRLGRISAEEEEMEDISRIAPHSLASSAMCRDGCRAADCLLPSTETRRSWDRNAVMPFSGIDLCVTPGDTAAHGAWHQTGGKIKMNSSFEMQMWNVTTWCQQPHLPDSLSLNYLQKSVNINCKYKERIHVHGLATTSLLLPAKVKVRFLAHFHPKS